MAFKGQGLAIKLCKAVSGGCLAKALTTHSIRFLGPKTILYKAFGLAMVM